VCCRNVLKYFGIDERRRILENLELALADGGSFVIGGGEHGFFEVLRSPKYAKIGDYLYSYKNTN
jgi:chemotaxis methyl-accepting protein methylase